jgi:hypothetical protein
MSGMGGGIAGPCAESSVVPHAIIQSIMQQMEAYQKAGSPAIIPASMALQPCMKSFLLEDAIVRIFFVLTRRFATRSLLCFAVIYHTSQMRSFFVLLYQKYAR